MKEVEGTGLCQPEKEKAVGRHHCVFQFLKGVYEHERNQLFTQVDSDNTRGNGPKLKERRFRLDVGESFLLSDEALKQVAQRGHGSPSFEVFKASLHSALINVI